MAKKPLYSVSNTWAPRTMMDIIESSMITVPFEAELALELLTVNEVAKITGRYLLNGDDATIGFNGTEISCLINGEFVGKTHSFSKFVRKHKEAYEELRDKFAEIGAELELVTGRFRRSGPAGEPLFAAYLLSLFKDRKPGFINVEAPLFEWERAAFPGPSFVVNVPQGAKGKMRPDIEKASSEMMAALDKQSYFEGIYWSANEFRFRMP